MALQFFDSITLLFGPRSFVFQHSPFGVGQDRQFADTLGVHESGSGMLYPPLQSTRHTFGVRRPYLSEFHLLLQRSQCVKHLRCRRHCPQLKAHVSLLLDGSTSPSRSRRLSPLPRHHSATSERSATMNKCLNEKPSSELQHPCNYTRGH